MLYTRDLDADPYDDPPLTDDEMQLEWCPYCGVEGIVQKCKVVCPVCKTILVNCAGD